MPAATPSRIAYPAIFLAAGLYVFIVNFALISPILLSFLLILVITLALNPLVVGLRRIFIRRDLATLAITGAFLVVVAFAAWAFYTPLARAIGSFWHHFPEYWQKLEAPLRRLDGAPSAPGPQGGNPTANGPQRTHLDINAVLSHLGAWAQSLVSNTAAMAAVVLTVFVGVVYTLINPRPVFRAFFALVPEEVQETAQRIAQRVTEFIPRWALALLSAMASVGGLVFLAVWPILGLQNAVFMGVLAFVFEAIPYIGAIIAGAPALLLATQQGGSAPLWVVVAYVCIQLFEHNVVNPLLVGRSVRTHPLAVIAAALFCLPTFGILGVLLAVPLVATLEILYDEIYRPRFLPNTTTEELDSRTRAMLSRTPPEAKPEQPKSEIGGEAPRSKRLRHPGRWTGP